MSSRKAFAQALFVVLSDLASARDAAEAAGFAVQSPLDPFRLLDAVHQEQYRDVPPRVFGPPEPDPVAADRLELDRELLRTLKRALPKREPWEERDDD